MSAELAKQWIAKAQNDLLDADNNLRSQEVPYDTVCFHCQQAAEKLLKSFLAYSDYSIPRTHDLLAILEKVKEISSSSSVEDLREPLIVLNPYAVEVRYPDDATVPVPEEADEAREAAEKVRLWLNSILPDLF